MPHLVCCPAGSTFDCDEKGLGWYACLIRPSAHANDRCYMSLTALRASAALWKACTHDVDTTNPMLCQRSGKFSKFWPDL